MKNNYKELLQYFSKDIEKILYGEITLKIKVHNGVVALVEKTLTERTKPEEVCK